MFKCNHLSNDIDFLNALLLFRVLVAYLIRGRVWKPPVDVRFIGDCLWFLRHCVGQFASQEGCVNPSVSKHLPLRVGDSKLSLTSSGTKTKTELLFFFVCVQRGKIAMCKKKKQKATKKKNANDMTPASRSAPPLRPFSSYHSSSL